VVVFDLADVVPSRSMVTPHRFRIDAEAMVLVGRMQGSLPYQDIGVLIAAEHRGQTQTTTQRQVLNPAALSSGDWPVLLRTTVTENETVPDRESVLYIFRRSGAGPWLLREHGTNWDALGEPLEPTERGNFWKAARELRSRAPHAIYNEQLSTQRTTGERPVFLGPASVRTSSASHVDVQAHVLALCLARP
jgi:hypothetical protein